MDKLLNTRINASMHACMHSFLMPSFYYFVSFIIEKNFLIACGTKTFFHPAVNGAILCSFLSYFLHNEFFTMRSPAMRGPLTLWRCNYISFEWGIEYLISMSTILLFHPFLTCILHISVAIWPQGVPFATIFFHPSTSTSIPSMHRSPQEVSLVQHLSPPLPAWLQWFPGLCTLLAVLFQSLHRLPIGAFQMHRCRTNCNWDGFYHDTGTFRVKCGMVHRGVSCHKDSLVWQGWSWLFHQTSAEEEFEQVLVLCGLIRTSEKKGCDKKKCLNSTLDWQVLLCTVMITMLLHHVDFALTKVQRSRH